MADVITRFKLETSQYDSKLRDASKALADIGKKAAEAGRGFDKFAKDSLESAKALGGIGTSATNAKGKVQELVGAYNDVARAYDKLTQDQKQSDFGKAMAGSLQQLQGRIREAKQELYSLDDAAKKVKSNKGALNQLLGGVAGKFGMSASMFTGVGAAVAGIGALTAAMKQNIETAKGFEKSMSGLSALTGMVGKDLDVLKEYAIELGSKTTLTASQVADAFKLIGSQQPQLLSSASALKEVTQYAIRLSEAAGIDLATASQTLSASINQMGGDSNNAARYVNVLAAASQKGAGDIAWLGESITKAATAAKAVGTDYEELVANLEQLAKAGFDASTAGTALRSIIMNLEKQANQDFKPSVVGLTQAFDNLAKAELDITGYQQIAGKMFATQAKVLAEAAGAAREMTDAITDTNIAEQQASTNTANLDGALKSLGSAWEGLNLHINSSNGFLKSTVDWLKEVVVWADQTFTAAGKAQRRLAELQGGGNGEPTKVESQVKGVQNLGGDRAAQIREIYRIESEYQQRISNLNAAIANGGKLPGAGSGESRDVRSLKLDLDAMERMYKEFQDNVKNILNPSSDTTSTPTTTIEVDADTEPAVEKLSDLKAKLKELRAMRDEAINEGDFASRDDYNAQIKEVQNRIKELQGTLKVKVEPEEGSIDYLTQYIKGLKDKFNATTVQGERDALRQDIAYAERILEQMNGKLPNGTLFGKSESLSERLGLSSYDYGKKNMKLPETKVTTPSVSEDDMPELEKLNATMSKFNGGVGSIVAGLKSIGIDLGEDVNRVLSAVSGVTQIISGVSSVIELFSTSSQTANTIALTANTTAIAALTAAVSTNTITSFLPFFAGGGVVRAANGFEVPGNHFSGDMVPAMLNSGEVVLNRAQVGVLGSSLQQQAANNRQVLVTKVKGTDLLVMLDQTGKLTGKGELMFWR